jgi:uncharacterized protein YndB with AHSA1/START domain
MTDRIERTTILKATPARVWRALTDASEFGTWFRAALDGPFVPGAWVRGRMTMPGYEHFTFDAFVVAMEPERYFAFRWPYVEPGAPAGVEPPTTLVEFRLEPVPTGTRLTVTESGFEALPEARRAAAIRDNTEGWTIQLENVRAHVEP